MVYYADSGCTQVTSMQSFSFPTSCQTNLDDDDKAPGANSKYWTCFFGESLPVFQNSFVIRLALLHFHI